MSFGFPAAALAACLAGPGTAQHAPPASDGPMRTYSVAPVGAASAAAWRGDLRALVDGLESVHPDPYGRVDESSFDSAVAALDRRIPDLAAHEIIVGFARLLALVGDGHTSLPLYAAPGVDFHLLPYRLGFHADGVFVEAADRRYAGLVGRRVLTLGGVPIEEAVRRVTPLVSRDNDNWVPAVAPNLLNRIEVLHALGIARGLDGVELTVESPEPPRSTAMVEPLSRRTPRPFGLPFLERITENWVDARDEAPRPVPLHQRRFEDLYWWEYLQDEDMLYIKMDQVQNRPHGPGALEVFREALALARERTPAKTVIDLRNNTGGEGGLLPAIIREIVRTREIDEPGRLYAVIGRRTFSAAQMFTAALERYTTAILVGEPSSAYYNGPAGHEAVRLPGSGLIAMISADHYQMSFFPRDTRRQATPDLAAVPTFEHYRANIDPALAVIREHEPGRLAADVMAAVEEGDTIAAARLVREHDARPVNRFRDGTSEVNALGYRLLRSGRLDEALLVFRVNARAHPDVANVWDSLGEAYVHAGREDAAMEAFRRALAIDPSFPPSRAWLHRLSGASP